MSSPSQPKTLVVIDDDEAVLNALTFSLGAVGYLVRAFRSARAVEAAEGLTEACCLIVDHILPDESGLGLLARLRARGVSAPAILITTHPHERLLVQAASMSVPVVEKPLLGDRLFNCIDAQIAQSPR